MPKSKLAAPIDLPPVMVDPLPGRETVPCVVLIGGTFTNKGTLTINDQTFPVDVTFKIRGEKISFTKVTLRKAEGRDA